MLRVRSVRGAAIVAIVVAVLSATGSGGAGASSSGPAANGCKQPVLVLSAMPLELYPLLQHAQVEAADVVRIDGRVFYPGTLAGNDVVLAMTGIGLANAAATARTAFEHFRCPFRAAVFSGVAGSKWFIGDVTAPQQWTMDGGKSWLGVNNAMLDTARVVQRTKQLALIRDVPVGDAACMCPHADAATPVHLDHVPEFHVGGRGTSADTFDGKAIGCVPGGGDIAGCEPCLAPGSTPADVANFAANAPSLADPAFFEALLGSPDSTTQTYDSQDEETASVATVARSYHVPFLGFRAVSDGQGDPLHLPGFPWQFFVYRQLAAHNAATVTMAFLSTWAARHRPV